MKLELIEQLGDGAFADVWRARDELDREVAVKIVREASLGVADALAHAKALARATHPNVVAVLTLETIQDPNTGKDASCVVMELIHGVTLATYLSRGKLTATDVVLFGLGIIDGLAHIHAQGMAHGDLHAENVMIGANVAKIIDILYLNSLSTLTSENRASRLNRDILSLRLMIQELIVNSDIDSAEATEFNNMLGSRAQLNDIRTAFIKITSPDDPEREQRTLDHLFSRVVDTDFVEGEAYAAALGEDTPDHAVLELLERIANELVYEYKHSNYVRVLWSRLSVAKRSEFLTHLSAVIDKETPRGKWSPNLRLLATLPRANWSGLRKLVQIRLEELITKDVLAGHVDIHGTKKISGGILGTYANSFWGVFQNKGILADNLISLLRQSWYTQNYVGSYFMTTIPPLAEATGKRTEFINAFRSALNNDARIVTNKLEELPPDWAEEIRAK
ncbi:protein kinase [Pseudomonas sp. SWRI74]|uniref:Protein kinase n=1 Tax=Pseudomonas azerbaijanoccidentalis TaxID=2842347 RepID=A0ABS6QQ92_9PSED|nr:protein kinase [Pseudomonas azerbaijanoccidentalis]MBV4520870.1 protein kinase [Pseudomonas azerbaijanoccidentalis]